MRDHELQQARDLRAEREETDTLRRHKEDLQFELADLRKRLSQARPKVGADCRICKGSRVCMPLFSNLVRQPLAPVLEPTATTLHDAAYTTRGAIWPKGTARVEARI